MSTFGCLSTGTGCGCGGSCGTPPLRRPVTNPPGLARLDYRTGDFGSFRRALLQHRTGEVELLAWQPTAGADLGLQVIDWWAFVADVLTFYNEQIANESFLRTARLEVSARNLVALLGYRPRPGIGARGRLAVLAAGPQDLLVPAGFAVASKAGPELPSQTFETTAAVRFSPPSSVPPPGPDDVDTPPPDGGPPGTSPPGTAQPPPHERLIARGGVLLKGLPTGLAAGDRLLLAGGTPYAAALVTVTGSTVEPDPYGRRNTRVLLAGADAFATAGPASGHRLLRASRTAHLASLPTGAKVVSPQRLVLDAPARYLAPGDPVVVDHPAGPDPLLVQTYQEKVWYANAVASTPETAPPGVAGIPLVVSLIDITAPTGHHLDQATSANATVLAGWTPVGVLLDTPVAAVETIPATLTVAAPLPVPAGLAQLEDATGAGAEVQVTPGDRGAVAVAAAGPASADRPLQAPLRLLWDLIEVSRGATVRDEVLGTGDATRAGQDFVLARTPVTYLTDYPGRSGPGWSSTVTVAVAGRYWTEVPSLYGRKPDEEVFETYEDADQRTHVRTGDGRNGRRLPTGAAVVATYRIGSGAATPPPGALTQVVTAVPNLRSVRNPVPPAGGADPETASSIRRVAPSSVLTFGRAISGDDYAAVAAAAPGVTRAAAVWQWDPAEQRPTVCVYVGDDEAALAAARTAITHQADPSRPVRTVAAVQRQIRLQAVLQVDPAYVVADVLSLARQALIRRPDGLFAPGVLALGEAVYRSRVERVLLGVPGVLAAPTLRFGPRPVGGVDLPWPSGPRFDPGPGGYCTLADADLTLSGTGEP